MFNLVVFVFMVLLWIELANISSLKSLVRSPCLHAISTCHLQIGCDQRKAEIGLKAYVTPVQLAKPDDAGA